jgi:hypothetical protein
VEDGLAIMAKVHTVLLPMQQGDIWRVQIVWPNGGVHYFGGFKSRKEAIGWITTHAWLTRTVSGKLSTSDNDTPAE